jgi:predicted PhzF superfamily epimerase YddE/YHI9
VALVAEVDLCGHATLASAHILWEIGRLSLNQPARFHTLSGPLTAERHGDWIDMNFPAELAQPVTPPEDLLRALRVKPAYAGQDRFDYLV